ncbi:HAMP domain-containing sensor histidine kinase [Clostridium hydrogenum]|uniref:HAMP domain-containing sensor histidine kinase n=1 Tax=Clostridium hydrogenum TaxID=2855764 RepID=UPI001F180788|nr:HAMP domain-containing sensor histidine kinase [Clostridium hydrogenum]
MKLNINKLKLKWKIFGFIFGFCALLLVILWLFQIVFLGAFYKSVKAIEVKNAVNTIANNINNKHLSDLVKGISGSGEIYIEVASLDGTKILSSSNTKYQVSLKDKLEMISSAKSKNNEYYKHVISSPPKKPLGNKEAKGQSPPADMQAVESLMYAKIVKNSSGKTLVILVNGVISPVNATVTTLRYQLYVVTAIMILLSILLALIIAKRISKPIEEINKSAKILAGGNYDIHFNGKGFKEIEELSDTLNTTATELSKVEELRHELLANISHDLRTPLSLIYSYAEMIHDFPDEVTPEETQVIMDEVQRLKTLVDDVLDISKLEAGMQNLSLSRYNLTDSVRSIAERIGELVKKDGYSISFSYDKEVFVCADVSKITQVIYNLIINAINYTGKNKNIIVSQVIYGENVIIEVTDNGDGIAEENLQYIWDRYYKIDKRHKRAVMGTGLGLSIVKKVIELHGGKYGVKSKLGEGSTFWFELKIDKSGDAH